MNLYAFAPLREIIFISCIFVLIGCSETAPLPTAVSEAQLPTATQAIPTVAPTIETAVFTPTTTPSPPQTQTPVIPELATQSPTPSEIIHTVAAGETLISIALQYGLTTAEIAAANNLDNIDNITIGQQLQIPAADLVLHTATASPTAVSTQATTTTTNLPLAPNWPPSIFQGDLTPNYPQQRLTASGRLRLHFQPGTYAAANIDQLAIMADEILFGLEETLGNRLGGAVDVYLAGTLFGANLALQGFTQSYDYRTFVLMDAAFAQGELAYILAHELTHAVATHNLGAYSSPLLHEGLATYLPQSHLVQDSGYLTHEEICAAVWQTDSFQSATAMNAFSYGGNGFAGHLRTFAHYNLSACFVGYLIETYGLALFDQLYETGDYVTVYGRSLAELDADWQASLQTVTVTIDPLAFVRLLDEVKVAYESYFAASAVGGHANWPAYVQLNIARRNVNQGNFVAAETALQQFWVLQEN